jgi:hypothetical protein
LDYQSTTSKTDLYAGDLLVATAKGKEGEDGNITFPEEGDDGTLPIANITWIHIQSGYV